MSFPLEQANHEYAPWPHRAAMALVCVVFPLIWVGGLVTTYDAGMAVEDWPGTFGHNLFLFPWATWVAAPWNLFIEHGHRLLGALAGFITIGFLIATLLGDQRRWMWWVASVALLLVCFQGLLGGQRVLLNARWIALIHGCVGPIFFAFCCCCATLTSSKWFASQSSLQAGSLTRSALAGLALAYSQLVLGAFLRHPSDDGSPYLFRQILWFHMFVGFALVGHIVAFAYAIHVKARNEAWLKVPAQALVSLAAVQIVLGLATLIVKYGWPQWLGGEWFAPSYTVQVKNLWSAMIVTAHVANGSLILAQLAVLWLRCVRVCGWGCLSGFERSWNAAGVVA